MCWLLLEGFDELDRVDQTTSVDATDWSERNLMLSGRRDCWSWSVDAAEGKKAQGASIWALLIPNPHLLLLFFLPSVVYIPRAKN